jgi:hypothetical protein
MMSRVRVRHRFRPKPSIRWGFLDSTGAKTFPLHAGQRDVLNAHARFKLALAGTGGGKTALGPIWLMQQIAENPGGLWLVVAPTYQIMARATAPTLVSTFAGTDFEGRYVESRNRYYLPDGGTIWLLSADEPQSLEAGQFDGAWVDEAGQISYDAWIALQGRVGQKQAPILLTTTPYGRNWLYKEFYLRFLQHDPDYYVRQWASFLNPCYPKAEYDRAKRSMAPQRAAMRYDGEFVKMMGLVYPDFEECKCEPFHPPEEARRVGGLDFGWNDPFAALAAWVYEDTQGSEVIYIDYERYKRFTPLKKHVLALPKDTRWFADPSRPDSIRELRSADVVVNKAKNSILVGVDAVNTRIYEGTLLIADHCRAVFAEANEYRYPEKDDETKGDRPVDGFNHALDALRYLVMGVDYGAVASSPEAEAA